MATSRETDFFQHKRRSCGKWYALVMDALPEPLTPKEHRRLVEIIGREAPDLLPLARDAVNTRWITDDESKALTDVLLDVFLRTLDREDEPTYEGAEADDLLGRIEMQRQGFWR